MRIACSAEISHGVPLREAFEAARDMGVGGLELWLGGDMELTATSWGDVAERLLSLMDEFHMRVAALGGSLGGPIHAAGRARRAEIWRRFLCLLEIASACAAPVVLLKSGPAPAHLGLVEASFRAQRLLRPMVECARQRHLVVCIEPTPRSPFGLPADAVWLLEACPGLKLTYNPAHFVHLGVPLMVTEALLAAAGHVRLRDAAPGRGRTAWGCGAVDPAWLLERLGRYSYDGAVAVEQRGSADAVRFLDDAVRIIREMNWLFRRLPPL